MSRAQQHILAIAIVLAVIVVCGIHVFLFPMYTTNQPNHHTKISSYEQVLCRGGSLNKKKYIINNNKFVPIEWINSCPKYGIVSATLGGRLGNQIFQYASVWATARKTGLDPFLPRCILKTLEEHFDNLSIPPLSYIGTCTIDVGQVVSSLGQWNSTEQNIIIPRYAAYWSLILLWLDDVRREFSFRLALKLYADKILKKISIKFNTTDPTYVGVHVRRTDYVDYLWQKLKIRPAPVRYYLTAMDYFHSKYENVIFVIASDSINWCKFNLNSKKHRVSLISDIKARGPGKDLAVLAACNHSIIDYGTYGSFAAILTGGETILYNSTTYFSTIIADVMPNWRIMS